MKRLTNVVQELSFARDMPTIQKIVRTAARRLTGADGATFVLRDNGQCFYVDEDAIEPLWKGLRFPMETCVSGWAMLHGESVVIPDIFTDPRVPIASYRVTFVKSLVMAPIRKADPIGAIGIYWSYHYQPTTEQIEVLEALADCTALAMENVTIFQELENRVKARTEELERACDEIRQLSLVDPMTGLYNRRGFELLASKGRLQAQRAGTSQFFLYVDADGLKEANDKYGHDTGDRFIQLLALTLRNTFRDADVIARLGGDEFGVLGCLQHEDDAVAVKQRLQEAIADFNRNEANQKFMLAASCGVSVWPSSLEESLEQLVARADQEMYLEKRYRKQRILYPNDLIASIAQSSVGSIAE